MTHPLCELVGRLRESIVFDDHARGCEGRQYSCTCGYDDRSDAFHNEAATAIESLLDEVEEARTKALRYSRALRSISAWSDSALGSRSCAEDMRSTARAALSADAVGGEGDTLAARHFRQGE